MTPRKKIILGFALSLALFWIFSIVYFWAGREDIVFGLIAPLLPLLAGAWTIFFPIGILASIFVVAIPAAPVILMRYAFVHPKEKYYTYFAHICLTVYYLCFLFFTGAI